MRGDGVAARRKMGDIKGETGLAGGQGAAVHVEDSASVHVQDEYLHVFHRFSAGNAKEYGANVAAYGIGGGTGLYRGGNATEEKFAGSVLNQCEFR